MDLDQSTKDFCKNVASKHGSRPVERILQRVQHGDVDLLPQTQTHRPRQTDRQTDRQTHGDVDLAGLAGLLDEDGAEEEENVDAVVLRSQPGDNVMMT